jgi:hypothetical protein
VGVAALGLFTPACCCGGGYGTGPPGPPGTISGQIYFPARITPGPLAVYAVSTYSLAGTDIRYVVTTVTPPDWTYHVAVPPGNYWVVARLDSDPLSSAGHLECTSDRCSPATTRAGETTCQTISCQPTLANVLVSAGHSVAHVDIGGWGSTYALDTIWRLDEFGIPGPRPRPDLSPSPTESTPSRNLLPSPGTADFTTLVDVSDQWNASAAVGKMYLPKDWREVPNPAQRVETARHYDYTNQAVSSPLTLDADGLWLAVAGESHWCSAEAPPNTTAQHSMTPRLFFVDPYVPAGRQPFSGYALVAFLYGKTDCLVFRFTASSLQAREKNLPTFLAILDRAFVN